MKPVTKFDSAFTVIGTNQTNRELNDSETQFDDFSLKEWLREIRIEKILENKNEKK
ncbi:MAG: hypothetical protein KA715_09290 [Xanthomonadaceae bacterium]|nr:hypothetical protein [Xanthomonadaceae bacterium]